MREEGTTGLTAAKGLGFGKRGFCSSKSGDSNSTTALLQYSHLITCGSLCELIEPLLLGHNSTWRKLTGLRDVLFGLFGQCEF